MIVISRTVFILAILLVVSDAPLATSPSTARFLAAAVGRVGETEYNGWHGQQISNEWVQLIVVPQNGGRLMQVTFNGHPYFFVNPKLAGKYMPPSQTEWFNYGGDKLWPLPEGNDDEQHWRG